MKLILEIAVATLLTIAALLAFAKGSHADGIVISQAVAEASLLPNATTGAAYLVIKNETEAEDQLIGVSSESADMAMLHKTTNMDGVMSMEHVDALSLAPGATVDLIAEGYHVMLVGLKAPLKAGDVIPLTLTFKTAGDVVAQARIGKGVKLRQ
jgi:periplasmic copper chaperone A